MKKSISFLCGTLLLGVVLLFNTEGELPLHWFQPFLRIQTSKAIIKGHCLSLFNVKIVRKKSEFYCPKLVLHFRRNGVTCHVNQAVLKYGPHVFSHINGVVKEHGGSYKAFLELENRNFLHMQMVGDAFIPKTFRALAEAVDSLKTPSGSCFVRDLKVHIAGKYIYNQVGNLTFNHMHATGGYGCFFIDGAWLKYLQKSDSVAWQNLCLAPVHGSGILNLQTDVLRQAFVQAQMPHEYLGATTLALNAHNISLGEPIAAYP